jgi:hypothetical protein
MKRASLWLALSLAAALPFHGQNSATVALGGTSSHGDRETLKGLTQIPGVEGFSLEDVRWSGTSGDLRRMPRASCGGRGMDASPCGGRSPPPGACGSRPGTW